MDKAAPRKEAPEVVRESLIGLSYSLPDKAFSSKDLSEYSKTENTVEVDGKEKYRSELISLSYLQSPEALPAKQVKV